MSYIMYILIALCMDENYLLKELNRVYVNLPTYFTEYYFHTKRITVQSLFNPSHY